MVSISPQIFAFLHNKRKFMHKITALGDVESKRYRQIISGIFQKERAQHQA
jgi:hypothetical protein